MSHTLPLVSRSDILRLVEVSDEYELRPRVKAQINHLSQDGVPGRPKFNPYANSGQQQKP